MTETQIDYMKHALKNGNRFYTSAGNEAWNDLVEKGYAVKRPGWEESQAYFFVTDEGKAAVTSLKF